MTTFKVIGILIKDRIKEAGRTQQVLSQYGHIIKMRLGHHEVSEEKCSRVGIIILTLGGNEADWKGLESDLSQIGGIEVRDMQFNY